MTYREKHRLDHPDRALDIEGMCPTHFGYKLPFCANPANKDELRATCEACWNQEMPGDSNVTLLPYKPGDVAYGTIKDSGERRQFETGAVRDIQEGKGRCDLMPLEVAAEYLVLAGLNEKYDKKILEMIVNFQNTGITHHLYMAIGYFVEKAYSGSDTTMFLEVAKHFEEGAKKYGENNWQKGLPVKCYIDSAVRHYLKWLRGDKDEPHDRAFVWNLLCCIWEVDFSPRAKGETAVADTIYKDNDGTVRAVNSGRLYICNREPCEKCHSDCHCTTFLGDAAVLELSDRDVRYEDCPIGLFMFDSDGVFLKTEIVNVETGLNTAVHIGLGLSRKFEADTMVTPIKHPFKERERV